jgi:Uma2 family endonuclease
MTVAANRPPEDRLGAGSLTDPAELADDLPNLPPCDLYSDEPEMETDLHLRQMLLLIECLEWFWRAGGPAERHDYFVSGNLTIYYSQNQVKNRDFRGPDFFVVQGVEPRERKSWTVWEEDGRYPDVIVEILSESTATSDRISKKELYQTTFRTPEYFWFSPETLEFQGFYLIKNVYQPITPNAQGWLWSDELNLFLGIRDRQLRYFTAAGELVPTPQEAALQETQQRELAEARAAKAEARAAELAAKLRELNIDPDSI